MFTLKFQYKHPEIREVVYSASTYTVGKLRVRPEGGSSSGETIYKEVEGRGQKDDYNCASITFTQLNGERMEIPVRPEECYPSAVYIENPQGKTVGNFKAVKIL